MKKYAVLSLCSIATEDDDGEAEERHIEKRATEPTISDSQIKELQMEIRTASNGAAIYRDILAKYKIQDLKELKASVFNTVLLHISTTAESK